MKEELLADLLTWAFQNADEFIKDAIGLLSNEELADALADKLKTGASHSSICEVFATVKKNIASVKRDALAMPRKERSSRFKKSMLPPPSQLHVKSLPPRDDRFRARSDSLTRFLETSVLPYIRELQKRRPSDAEKCNDNFVKQLRLAIGNADNPDTLLKASDNQLLAALNRLRDAVPDAMKRPILTAFNAARLGVELPSSSSSSVGASPTPRFGGVAVTSASRSNQTQTSSLTEESDLHEEQARYAAKIVQTPNVQPRFRQLPLVRGGAKQQKAPANSLKWPVNQGSNEPWFGVAIPGGTELVNLLCEQSASNPSQSGPTSRVIAMAPAWIGDLLFREMAFEESSSRSLMSVERIRQFQFLGASDIVEAMVNDDVAQTISRFAESWDDQPGKFETELAGLLRQSFGSQALDIQQSYVLTSAADFAAALLQRLGTEHSLDDRLGEAMIRAINGAVDGTGFSFKACTYISIGGTRLYFSEHLTQDGSESLAIYKSAPSPTDKLGTPFIVKTLTADATASAAQRDEHLSVFAQEYLMHVKAYAESTRVVKPMGASRSADGTLALVLAHCPHGTQQQVLEKLDLLGAPSGAQSPLLQSLELTPADLDTVRAYVAYQNFQCLQHLKNQRMTHFNMKPDNFYIGHDNIKIGNFGTAFCGLKKFVESPVKDVSHLAPEIGVWDWQNRDHKSKVRAKFHMKPHGTILPIRDLSKEIKSRGMDARKLRGQMQEQRERTKDANNKPRNAASQATPVPFQVEGSAVDVWSVGVGLIQLYVPNGASPVMAVAQKRGDSTKRQLTVHTARKMKAYLISTKSWKSQISLPSNPDARALIEGCLRPEPSQRITPEEALQSPLFAQFSDELACRHAHGMLLTLVQRLRIVVEPDGRTRRLTLSPPPAAE